MFETRKEKKTYKGFFFVMVASTLFLGDGLNAAAIGMPNPASVYCYEMGFDIEMEVGEQGESSVCLFPDGSQCDVWEFLDGMCGAEYSICAESGYEMMVAPGGQFSAYTAYCVEGEDVVGSVIHLAEIDDRSKGTTPQEIAQDSPVMTISLPSNYEGDIKDIVGSTNTDNMGNSMPTGRGDVDFSWHSSTDPSSDYMSSVKDQVKCGSCWAFAAVGVVEGAYSVFYDNPWMKLDLAEEYLNSDCSDAGSCCGGSKSEALSVFEDEGVPDEGCMPYSISYRNDSSCECFGLKKEANSINTAGCSDTCPNNKDGACSFSACYPIEVGGDADNALPGSLCGDVDQRRVRVDQVGHVTVESGNDGITVEGMKQALRDYGPLAVSYAASADKGTGQVFHCDDCWRDEPEYEMEVIEGNGVEAWTDTDEDCISEGVCGSSGVCESGHFNAKCESDADCFNDVDDNGTCDVNDCAVNHSVIITGWSDALEAWEVKNSWGDTWEIDGYFFLKFNDCHVQKNAVYPILDASDILPITAFAMESPIVISGDVVIKDRAFVVGNITLGGDLRMNNDSSLSGSAYVEGDVDFGDRVSVILDVVAGGAIAKGHDSTINGVEIKNSEYSFSGVDISDVSYGGSEAIEVGHDQERLLFPGSYYSLNVSDRGKVELAPGDYFFSYIALGNDSSFISQSATEDVRIFIDYGIEMGDRVSIGASNSTSRFQIVSDWNFVVDLGGNQTSIQYLDVLAPNAQIWVAPGAKISGGLVGRYLSVGNGASVYGR